jgi:Sulfotransferase family
LGTVRDDGDRFFFVHVPKTGGASLLRRLQHHFGERAVYPDASDALEGRDEVISVRQLQQRFRARRDEIRVVTGHFPLCTSKTLDCGFTTLTVLRHPIERTLSYLRHHRLMAPEDRDKRLEEIYSDPYRFDGLVHNQMTKMFSLTPVEATAWMQKVSELFGVPRDEVTEWMLTRVEFTRDRLERAKQGLESVDAIGLQERFEEFCEDVSHRFGWDLGPRLHENPSEPSEPSKAFRARIAEDNAMDIEVYEFARGLYERRRAETRLSVSVPPSTAPTGTGTARS